MPINQNQGKAYHDATKHSYLSVQVDPNYVDASTQPVEFKVYPKFYRRVKLNVNNPVHAFIWLTSAVTSEKVYKGVPDKLRVNPSAGAFYPTEVYIQIRGIEGMIDGIYHLEVENNCLTLIYELIDDGLESYIIPSKSISGFIFLISCVYYRSSWKYQDRSLRYCFLDSGHHLGAFASGVAKPLAASAYLHEKFQQTVWNRRSIRRFRKQFISHENYLYILQQLEQPIPTKNGEDIEIYSVLHRVEGMSPGLYKSTLLLQAGNFCEQTGYLCINQAIARDCAVNFFFVSDYTSYQTAMQLAAFLGQRIYLGSNYLGIQCSGIGAYYDDETRRFLETTKDILYAMAIGI
jgi:SagB-type dehydrogenase family enzyme